MSQCDRKGSNPPSPGNRPAPPPNPPPVGRNIEDDPKFKAALIAACAAYDHVAPEVDPCRYNAMVSAIKSVASVMANTGCGWRPIEEAPKFGDLPVLVWDGGDLVEVLWEREHKTDSLSWCQFSTDKYGTDVWKMEPQPKYYLAVTAPPEG